MLVLGGALLAALKMSAICVSVQAGMMSTFGILQSVGQKSSRSLVRACTLVIQ